MAETAAPTQAIVVGAGVVGACAALGLAARGVHVTLLEAQPPPAFELAHDDLRVFAVAPASLALLDRVGALATIRAWRWSPYRAMSVWQDDPAASLDFDAHQIAHSMLGAIVEDGLLRDALWARLLATPGIDVVCPATVAGIHPEAGSVRVKLASGRVLVGDVVVGADGAQSGVRRALGIEVALRDYGVRAIVAHVRTREPHRHTAWQRFTPEGPLAFLPLSDGRCSVVWSLPEPRAAERLALPDAEFAAQLGDAFQQRLGPIDGVSARASFPLRRQLVTPSASGRVVLIGDAAHSVHPLAGQGLNLGLQDAGALIDALGDAAPGGIDAALAAFCRWRDSDNARAALMFEGLNDLFGDHAPGMGWLRQRGMQLVGAVSPLRREFALHAAGWAGRVPTFMRRP